MRSQIIGHFYLMLKEGHGGGNWRRLISMKKDELLEATITQLEEAKLKEV